MPYKDKEKQKAAQHESYLRNKTRVREATKTKTDAKRKWIQDVKEASGCVDCGEKFKYYTLHFDHKPEFVKLGSISMMVAWWNEAQLLEEMAKCDIVCANCHSERTHKRLNAQ